MKLIVGVILVVALLELSLCAPLIGSDDGKHTETHTSSSWGYNASVDANLALKAGYKNGEATIGTEGHVGGKVGGYKTNSQKVLNQAVPAAPLPNNLGSGFGTPYNMPNYQAIASPYYTQFAPQPSSQYFTQAAPQPFAPQPFQQYAPQQPQVGSQYIQQWPQYASQQASQVAPQYAPQYAYAPQYVPQSVPQGAPQNAPQYAPQGVPQYAPHYAPPNGSPNNSQRTNNEEEMQ